MLLVVSTMPLDRSAASPTPSGKATWAPTPGPSRQSVLDSASQRVRPMVEPEPSERWTGRISTDGSEVPGLRASMAGSSQRVMVPR